MNVLRKAMITTTMFALAFMVTILLAGCGEPVSGTEVEEMENGENTNILYCNCYYMNDYAYQEPIDLRVMPCTLTRTQVYLRLTNNMDVYLLYGYTFFIQKNIDGVWAGVPAITTYLDFLLLAYRLLPGAHTYRGIGFSAFGELANGDYRITIEVSVGNDGTQARERVPLTAEFTICDATP